MCEHFTASQQLNRQEVECDLSILQSNAPQPHRRKRGLNVVQQLMSREISTSNELFPHSFITKEPLKKFKLRKIVNKLGRGHVFLGFTKNGQFLVSYTLQVDMGGIMLPVYTYKLYWWHFVPDRPLRLVNQVDLFGEPEINIDLHILVCQWPSDETKVLVYGLQRASKCLDQQSQQCYITITAIPSLEFCPNCFLTEEGKKSNLCLEHGFAIHTQYQIAPPFPEFVPTVCLKIDGTVIINTSDSLVALNVSLNLEAKSSKETKTNSHTISNDADVQNGNTNTEKPENHRLCSKEELGGEEFSKSNVARSTQQCDMENVNCDTHSSVLKAFSGDGSGNANEASTSCQQECFKDEYLFVTETDEESAKENISPQNCSVSDMEENVKCQKDKATEIKKDVISSSNKSNFLSCVTCLKGIFVDKHNPISLDEDCESSNNGYHNYLPLEVRGSNYQEMRCLPYTRRSRMIKEGIVVHQQIFDVEQFVHEVANRLCSNYGKKYLAVDDYDIQVVDVDPETGDVTGLAFILIKATNSKNQLKCRYTSNFYQAKLILVWNIYTGENRIELLLYFLEKTESSNTKDEEFSLNQTSPQMPLHYQLEKIMGNVPKTEMKSVKVLSNLPALKGTSLTSIVSPYQHIALVL